MLGIATGHCRWASHYRARLVVRVHLQAYASSEPRLRMKALLRLKRGASRGKQGDKEGS